MAVLVALLAAFLGAGYEQWSGHLGPPMQLDLGSLLDGNKGKRGKFDVREGLG
jgi:hypothetical protein